MTHWKVALPMYNVGPVLIEAYTQFLRAVIAGLRARGWRDEIEVVSAIDDLESFWLRPDMLLSQTCGYPLMTALRDRVQLLGTPMMAVDGCHDYFYRSVIVARAEDDRADHKLHGLPGFRGTIGVVSQLTSHSGMNALRHSIAPFAHSGCFFAKVQLSGSHLNSLAMLRSGAADLAAIDCVTFACASRYFPEKVAGLRVVEHTIAAPGLPLIASLQLDRSQTTLLAEVVASVCHDPQIAGPLQISGWARTTWQDYAAMMAIEQYAVALGYPEVA
ncbi:phosphate/phosphite/phosphonate ABC transporter substrate-binding protein [Glaciimonas sp. PCH181]|uniref:phosphate/phosphite/phosphonate ABC transporter substrate-binding protein n=1 Tax=Glaciimonas sp. PCH181 TaxID=2133943 RepID=UPI000D3745B4|nr:PhnD/SsuA/transferrin family substrate-binding protein [Glaciimonas sp. PCH181]PUA18025.1 phosphate ABC transporter substrate-binding protein [Glaciimonas sp. PCH181]